MAPSKSTRPQHRPERRLRRPVSRPDGRPQQHRRPPPSASTTKAGTPATASSESGDDDVASDAEEVPIFERTSLSLASNPLPPMITLASTLSKFTNLHKLDVSYMQPGSPADDEEADDDGNSHGIENLRFLQMAQLLAQRDRKKEKGKARAMEVKKTLADTLTWLNLAGNPSLGQASASSSKNAFQGLETASSLFVLNLSSCSLRTIPPKATLMGLAELRALILTHNRLDSAALDAIPYLPNLNTLVLSHNDIQNLPASLPANLPQLAKLSISHNKLTGAPQDDDDDDDPEVGGSEPLPDFTICSALREVRLSHNPQLSRLPSHINQWGRGTSGEGRGLDLLDVGHCRLTWANVSATLLSDSVNVTEVKRLHALKSLTLAGNVDIEDEEDYREKVKTALPGLTVLDNQRLMVKAKRGERVSKGVSEIESGAAQWPQRSGPSSSNGGGVSEVNRPSTKQQRNLVDGLNQPQSAKEAHRLSRAGPAPSSTQTDDEEEDAGVASDEETRSKEIIEQPKLGKRKRAKRGKKREMWTGADTDAAGGDTAAQVMQNGVSKSGAKGKSKKYAKEDGKGKEGSSRVEKGGGKAKFEHREDVTAAQRPRKEKDKKPRVAWDASAIGTTQPEPADGVDERNKEGKDKTKSSRSQTSVAGIVEVKRPSDRKSKRGGVGDVDVETGTPFIRPASALLGGETSAWAEGAGTAWD